MTWERWEIALLVIGGVVAVYLLTTWVCDRVLGKAVRELREEIERQRGKR
jgi:hypothetical protein